MLMAHKRIVEDESGEEEVMFNPAEHKDLAHFFTQVDQAETFALTANEWLGIRSGGQQFEPVGSVGPDPSRPNPSLTNATRSLMAFNKPVTLNHYGTTTSSHPGSRSDSLNGVLPSPSAMMSSVRAWRPHEAPFDPTSLRGHGHSSTHHSTRRASTSSSNGDHSLDAAAQRKRPAPSAAQSENIPTKRPRSLSAHARPAHSAPSVPSISPVTPSTSTQCKPPLLTAEQKKANHILSEQKRRAKIRRGYDALCEVVPSLKNAILAEQEAFDSKKKRGKAKPTATDEGRAGPKSESIVLSQTIEHIEHLVARKEDLLARLRKAQSMLPAGHHGLGGGSGDSGGGGGGGGSGEEERPWEKEWDGGTGIEDGEDEEEESDEEDTA